MPERGGELIIVAGGEPEGEIGAAAAMQLPASAGRRLDAGAQRDGARVFPSVIIKLHPAVKPDVAYAEVRVIDQEFSPAVFRIGVKKPVTRRFLAPPLRQSE